MSDKKSNPWTVVLKESNRVGVLFGGSPVKGGKSDHWGHHLIRSRFCGEMVKGGGGKEAMQEVIELAHLFSGRFRVLEAHRW